MSPAKLFAVTALLCGSHVCSMNMAVKPLPPVPQLHPGLSGAHLRQQATTTHMGPSTYRAYQNSNQHAQARPQLPRVQHTPAPNIPRPQTMGDETYRDHVNWRERHPSELSQEWSKANMGDETSRDHSAWKQRFSAHRAESLARLQPAYRSTPPPFNTRGALLDPIHVRQPHLFWQKPTEKCPTPGAPFCNLLLKGAPCSCKTFCSQQCGACMSNAGGNGRLCDHCDCVGINTKKFVELQAESTPKKTKKKRESLRGSQAKKSSPLKKSRGQKSKRIYRVGGLA